MNKTINVQNGKFEYELNIPKNIKEGEIDITSSSVDDKDPNKITFRFNRAEVESKEKTTTDSMSLEEEFIKKYDTNGDNLLDANEFPQSKLREINKKDIAKGLDPYPSTQYLIEDFDINMDHKLSADELKNITNLNL